MSTDYHSFEFRRAEATSRRKSAGGGTGDGAPAAPRPRHWPDIARVWEQVGPPLRPSAQDVAVYADVVRRAASERPAPRGLILGVTPEIYRLPWPAGADVIAVDHTRGMIDTVWPGPRDRAVCGEWTALPLPDASRDMAFCDGGLHLLGHPAGQTALVRQLRRVLAPGGRCVFRLFVPPATRESPDAVLDDLLAGRVANLNLLKLRLGMSLQDDPAAGVELRRVWDALHRAAPDFPGLADRLGWSLAHLTAINTYRDCPNRYCFVTLDAARDLFCREPGGFELESTHVPTYELGERCPIVVFRRR